VPLLAQAGKEELGAQNVAPKTQFCSSAVMALWHGYGWRGYGLRGYGWLGFLSPDQHTKVAVLAA
jgi:hypothetical protein